MSLCVTIRTRDGGILMAADTAVSAEIDGVRYRIIDMYDENKIVVLQDGTMVFCSGEIEKCGKLRSAMRNMPALDLDGLQQYARELFGQNTDDDSSGIVVAFPDGKLVGMLSAQNFEIVQIPKNERGFDYFAFGFRQDEAYKSFEGHFANDEWDGKTPEVIQLIGNVFLDIHCEEVGRSINIYSRPWPNKPVQHCIINIVERPNIRKISAGEAKFRWAHGIIKARDIRLPNGDTMTSIINDKGKIAPDWVDLYGINVKNKAGNTVMTIDENGVRFGTGYSPIVYQFATSASGPWHSTMGSNDRYRRDSIDGGETWGNPYQFRGTDGQDGSDADVPSYIAATKILKTEIESPTIRGGEIHGGKIYGGEFITSGDGIVLNILDGRSMAPQGQITYSANGGLVIGSVSGVVLDHGERYPRMVDEYGESEIVSKNYLKNNPPVAVFG